MNPRGREVCERDCPKPLPPLRTQSIEHKKHWEGLSRALRWLQEEEKKNRGIRGDGSSRSMV